MEHLEIAAIVTVGVLTAAVLGAGIASATIPDSSGVIHGCYKSQSDGHNSALGVIDTALPNGRCPSGNTELTWNQTGPAGAPGATGPRGPAGSQATAQDVASQVTYSVGSGNLTQEFPQLDCPAGTLALNGGVTDITQQVDQGSTLVQAGTAVVVFADENPSGSESLGLPRPVNSGASWRMQVNVVGAIEDHGDGTRSNPPVTVTYYVVCE